jgi:zinc protease
MAFNGTRNFARNEMVNWLESVGMRFGPDTNAYTSFDETVYQLTVPTDKRETIEMGLLILEDWMQGLVMDSQAIEKERGVILEEWRLRREVWARVQDAQLPVLFHGSRYTGRLPIGKPETIQNAPGDAIRRFYRDWYRPDLAAVVAVGDFNPDEMETLIRRRFSQYTKPISARPREVYPVPPHGETLVSYIRDPELGSTTLGVYAKKEARPPRTVAEFRARIVEDLFFSIMNERLRDIGQRRDSPFLSAEAAAFSFIRPLKTYYAAAGVEEGGVAEGLAALVREMKRAAVHGFTETELERAKADLLRRLEQSYKEMENISSDVFVYMYVDNYLEGEPILGPEYSYRLTRRFLPFIEADELKFPAAFFLEEKNRVVLISGPESEEALSDKDILSILRNAAAEDVPAFVDEVSGGSLLEEIPQPGTALRVRSDQAGAAGLTEWKLGNGMRVVLKTTDFKNDEILMTAFSPGGTSLAADEDYISADFAENVAEASGVGPFSLVQLEKYISGKKVQVTPRIYGQTEGMQGSASVRDVEAFFQLIHAYFTAPRLDDEAMGSYLRQVKNSLRTREKQPETIFFNKVREILTRNHLRSRPLRPETVDKVDTQKAFDFYRSRFADAGDFTFIFVGSISPDELEPYLAAYLASLPGGARKESWKDTGMRLFRGRAEDTVHAGIEEKSLVALYFTGDFAWSRENVFRLEVLEAYLDLRLREILREDKGGTYGVSVSAEAYRYPAGEYSLGIFFGAAPDKAAELTGIALEAVREMKNTLPLAADAAKLREQDFRQHERMLRENAYWLNSLRFNLYHDLPGDIADYRPGQIRTITPELIQNLVRTYCNEENLIVVTLMPEK